MATILTERLIGHDTRSGRGRCQRNCAEDRTDSRDVLSVDRSVHQPSGARLGYRRAPLAVVRTRRHASCLLGVHVELCCWRHSSDPLRLPASWCCSSATTVMRRCYCSQPASRLLSGYVPYWLPSAAGLPAPLDGTGSREQSRAPSARAALIGGHPSTSYVCVGTCGFVDTTWRSWLHWLPVLGVYAWTMLSACVFCHRYRAACDLPALRKGLWLVGAGSALCLSWVGVRVAVLVAWHQGGVPTTWRSLDSWAEALIWAVSMAAVAVGALWEPLTRHVGTVAQDVRSLWRLHGLWRALVEVHPDVRLVRSSLTMRPRVRLVRRVVEIRDCLTRDRARREPASLSRCPSALEAIGVAPGPEADAWATAAMVSSALTQGLVPGAAVAGCLWPTDEIFAPS